MVIANNELRKMGGCMKINRTATTGFLLCFTAIIFGVLSNGGFWSILNLIHITSFIITFGGAFFAAMMTADSFEDFAEAVRSFSKAFQRQSVSLADLTQRIFELSDVARKEGLLALEGSATEIDNSSG